nr:bifunctional epoxide hydrolase 2 [Lonchura striata domestica]
MAPRAVIFGLSGVLLRPGLQHFLSACERDCHLPRGFLAAALDSGGSESLESRALRGQISLSQLQEELERRCRAAPGAAVPEGFSASRPFREFRSRARLEAPLLRAAAALRSHGFLTAVLANSWLDDTPGRSRWAELLQELRRSVHLVLESCRLGIAKPDPRVFSCALDALGVRPEEVLFLGCRERDLASARALGMAALPVRDTGSALRDLQRITGVQPPGPELPVAVEPQEVAHGYVEIRPGVRFHFAELGRGPALVLCHGFPESWLAWRFQLPALAGAGFRAMALDMKGFGESSAPPDVSEYSQERICQDFITFLDKLGLAQVVLIGHDWGGAVAWNVALFYPERLRAVASLNTPFRPAQPGSDPLEQLRRIPNFDYQLYFQQPGVAEAELEKDIERTLKILIRSHEPEDRLPVNLDLRRVQERGGLLVGLPEDPPGSRLLPPPALDYYVRQFRASGFRGPLNWYRNVRENWSWALRARHRTIRLPALLVTAGKDPVLQPRLSHGMEAWVPQLQRRHLENCGHWTQLERPAELNRILLEWLRELPPEPLPPNSPNSKL